MPNLLFEKRTEFFQKVASQVGSVPNGCQIVLTHLLQDRPELLDAFNSVVPIALVIGIPYSLTPDVVDEVKKKYNVATPSLNELYSEEYILGVVQQVLDASPGKKLIVNEIGGYFAPFIKKIHEAHGERIIGFIEDTQNGHVRYEASRPLPYPVLSVARSKLKEGEDALVGPSCYFSADRLLRSLGVLLSPRRALVVGYGKVGRGMAHSLQDNDCSTKVYDINPIRKSVAQGDGMLIPSREAALRGCDVIFGCTGVTSVAGSDFDLLDDGCFLVSCSSKDIEFDLKTLATAFTREALAPKIDKYTSKSTGKFLFLLGEGRPINFLDGAVFGPALSLVQAELILAAKEIEKQCVTGELEEIADEERKNIAALWEGLFIDPQTGSFFY